MRSIHLDVCIGHRLLNKRRNLLYYLIFDRLHLPHNVRNARFELLDFKVQLVRDLTHALDKRRVAVARILKNPLHVNKKVLIGNSALLLNDKVLRLQGEGMQRVLHADHFCECLLLVMLLVLLLLQVFLHAALLALVDVALAHLDRVLQLAQLAAQLGNVLFN